MDKKYISAVRLRNETFSDYYLRSLPVVKFLIKNDTIVFNKNITFFVGENGTGKSTLIEAIAVAYGFNAEGGTKNFNFSTKKSHSSLSENLMIIKSNAPKDGFFLRAESFYNVASHIEEIYDYRIEEVPYGDVPLHNQSHGESFLALVQNRFRPNGLYILDEPEAALSPSRIMALMIEINNLVKDGSQFIIATHSPILMTLPNSEIFEFSQNGIESVTYEETQHFQLTKTFVNAPERMLKMLLEEG